METNNVGKYTISFGLSLGLASLVSALLVILKEMNPNTVLPWMKSITGHHWITHSLFILILFVLVGWLLARVKGGQGVKMAVNRFIFTLVGLIVISGLIIAGFFLIGD